MPTIRRTYGRPRPLLVEECAVVRSELERFRLPTGALAQHEDVIRLIVTWSTGERRLLDLRVLVTASAVGKAKRWFACPCQRSFKTPQLWSSKIPHPVGLVLNH